MRNRQIRILMFIAALAASASVAAQSGAGRTAALKGHDPVAYFVDGRPVMGVSSIAYDFDDSRYHFSTPKHRDLFASDPDRYSPQFAGLCTAGLAMGKQTEADPSVWKIVNGKLYVFSSIRARERVEQDPSIIDKAEHVFRSR